MSSGKAAALKCVLKNQRLHLNSPPPRPPSRPTLTNEAPGAAKVRLMAPLAFHIQDSAYDGWGAGVLPRDANLACLRPSLESPRGLAGRLCGGLFLFRLHQHLASHFSSWQMEFCLPARMDDPAIPPPWLLIRATEIVFKIKIKTAPFLWTLEPVIYFT